MRGRLLLGASLFATATPGSGECVPIVPLATAIRLLSDVGTALNVAEVRVYNDAGVNVTLGRGRL